MAHAEIVVVPSIDDHWGIVVDEGMQLGKPVCASDATGSALDRISHGENGFLFKAGDSAELQKLLHKLMCQDDLRKKISVRARASASDISPPTNAETLTLAIHRVINNS